MNKKYENKREAKKMRKKEGKIRHGLLGDDAADNDGFGRN